MFHEPCGTGQLADSYRFTLTYDPPNAGPATIIGKFPSEDPASLQLGIDAGFYECEIRFYRDVAHTVDVATPRSIHAQRDESGAFNLFLEDMAPARSVDQIGGCTIEEAATVLAQAARLHAGSWGQAELLRAPWLQAMANTFTHVTKEFAAVSDHFRETFSDLVDESCLVEAARFADCVDPWIRILQTQQCLWHSDLRVDNILFDAKGGTEPVTVLDWQTVAAGVGVTDVSYFLGLSLTTEMRREHERDLLDHYHRELVAHGVTDYSRDRCWDDYRVQSAHGLQCGVFAATRVKRTERGDQMWKAWIERAAVQTRDLETFDLLGRR
ncbi:oxidoreductase family protein [Pseudonocardia endophytica]|nr:oxidoreductase family protein [Pseudonocardia endophytica]